MAWAVDAEPAARAWPRRTKMSTCPLCGEDIYADQHTTWRAVDGAPARVHGECLDPPVTRRSVQR